MGVVSQHVGGPRGSPCGWPPWLPRGSRMNQPQNEAELAAIRQCLARGRPFGGDEWQAKIARQLNLEHTFGPRGRPKKQARAISNPPK